jgi:hypothetical protein
MNCPTRDSNPYDMDGELAPRMSAPCEKELS